MTGQTKKEIIEFKPTAVPWRDFENEVAEFFEKSLPSGIWGMVGPSAVVRRKPAYYSKSREGDIIFDVSIEVHPGESQEILFLWLIECKNYRSHNVEVGEIEEFHKKMEQVSAHKGTMLTRHGFDEGTQKYARTHRIGLAVLNKEEYVSVMHSADKGAVASVRISMPFFQDGEESLHLLTHLIARTVEEFGILVPNASLSQRPISWNLKQDQS